MKFRLSLFIFSLLLLSCNKDQLPESEYAHLGNWELNSKKDYPNFSMVEITIQNSKMVWQYDLDKDGQIDYVQTKDYYSTNENGTTVFNVKIGDQFSPWTTYFVHDQNRYLYLKFRNDKDVVFERSK